MSGTSSDDTASTATAALGGELTFETLTATRRQLLDALDGADTGLRIDLSAVGTFDLSGVQLLYAAAGTARERGITLTFAYGENEERFRRFYRFAGLAPLDGGVGPGGERP